MKLYEPIPKCPAKDFSASVDSRSKGEGAGLSLRDIRGAEEVRDRCQDLVTIIGAARLS